MGFTSCGDPYRGLNHARRHRGQALEPSDGRPPAPTVAAAPKAAVGRTQRRGESVDAIPPARGSDTPIRVLNLVRTSEGDCVALSHRSTAGLTLTEVIHD